MVWGGLQGMCAELDSRGGYKPKAHTIIKYQVEKREIIIFYSKSKQARYIWNYLYAGVKDRRENAAGEWG